MKALLLAAGRGTRLGSLTDNTPKPMLPIGGVPMIERIMRGIHSEAGITQFVLVTGYKQEVVEAHFGTGDKWGWQVEYVHQAEQKGLGHAIHTAREPLKDAPFFMTYGDIMMEPSNYGRAVQEFNKLSPPAPNSGGAEQVHSYPRPPAGEGGASPVAPGEGKLGAIVGLNWVEDPWAGAAVYVNEDNAIQRIEEKPLIGTATTHWNNAGLFVFQPVLFEYTARLKPSPRGELELPDALTAMLNDGLVLQGMPLTGAWRDVGTPADYEAINQEYAP